MSRAVTTVVRYGSAVAGVAGVLLIEKVIGVDLLGFTPPFFAVVMISTWYGGLGPGLLAVGLAGLATAYFFMEPIHSPVVGSDDLIRLAVFLAVSVLISSLHSRTKRSEAALVSASAEAVAANRAKDRFLAILSHELRNPLNPVLVMAEIQERDPSLPAGVREDAAMIRRNVELEVRLIDDLLDLSRLSAGKMKFSFDDVDVHEMIHDVLRICGADVEQKGVRIVVHLAADVHWVRADGARLRQAMWNLLKNAAKFTPAGGTISITTDNPSAGRLCIEVTDTGMGIAPEVLPRLFNAFEQGSDDVTREFGGLGLGLAISRMVIAAHGGTLEVASEGRGKGATFIIGLPAQRRGDAVSVDAPGRGAMVHGTGRLRILLVEDHDDTSRIMRRLLQAMGHDVHAASNIASALALAEKHTLDLALCDLNLPDGTGFDLIRQLRDRFGLRGIALSGYGADEDLRKSKEAGFDRHLTKPIQLDELEAALTEHAASL